MNLLLSQKEKAKTKFKAAFLTVMKNGLAKTDVKLKLQRASRSAGISCFPRMVDGGTNLGSCALILYKSC